jgi:predicted Zn-dependent protease
VRRLATLAVGALLCANLSCSFVKKNVKMEGNVVDAVRKIQDLRKELTPENEYYVGRSVATNILAKHDYRYVGAAELEQGRIDPITAYVNRVGQIVVAAAMEESRDGDRPAPIAGWHFIVVESPAVNAIAAPGGFVFVTTAAVTLAENEDELACLLAHEVAHVVRGHALGSIKKSRWANMSKDLLDSTVQVNGQGLSELNTLFEGGMGDMMDAMFVKGYSKKTEFQADSLGFDFARRAGYDPGAMIAYLTRLGGQQETGGGGWHDTHPKSKDRVARLHKKLKRRPTVPPIRIARFRDIKGSLTL